MTLDDQLYRFVERWEPWLAREFWRYDRLLRAKSRRPPCAWGQTPSGPYWKELPRWLAGERGNGPRTVSPEFLDTVLWGQMCLFYAVRLQDDLLDGEFPRSPLVLAPLLFLTEADCAYSSLIERNAVFWKHYRRALETTVSGIVRVAEMQRDFSVPADELLQVYGDVDAVFSVGSLAVCQYLGTADWIPLISEFVREFGKVLLALDDVDDITEDLADRRLTYPARMLLVRRRGCTPDLSLLAKTWHRHVRAEGFDEIKTTLLRCLNRAGHAIRPLEIQPAMELIDTTRAAVQNLTADLRLTLSPL
jgi:hypothetical protein